MNNFVHTLLHPLGQPFGHRTDARPHDPPRHEGWPPLSVPTGTHRRASDAVPWYPDGPYDPWKRPPSPGA